MSLLVAGAGSLSLAALRGPGVSRQTQNIAVGHWGVGGSRTAGPGPLFPIAHGSFGKGFGARSSPGCFLPATRKKLFELARAFSEKTKMRKSKRKHLLKHQVYPKRGWGPVKGCGAVGVVLLGCFWGLPKAMVWTEPPSYLLRLGRGLGRAIVVPQPHLGPTTGFP